MDLNGSIFRLVASGLVIGTVLLGCGGSGDINISPVTSDTSTDNSVNNSNNVAAPAANPCASNGTIQGDFNAPHCEYSTAFADSGNNVTTDMTLVDLDDDGAHIFYGSLFIGEDYTGADLAAAGITKGGDGPSLIIEAGATLAFVDKTKFMVIMRGSQIQAVGSATSPITITSLSDVNGTIASPEAVQEWGGLVINGFGVTNKCTYTGTRGVDLALDGTCDVASEGSEGQDANHYGGANDADDSGRLEYFIVKHTGNQVANGDELNGITFSGVGNGTVVKNAQAYSTYDDGFEFFGGSVNVENYVALYVNDDSIDIDEGYNGTITNALIVQSETNGNRCIEADGIGSYSSKTDAFITDIIDRNLNSRPTIKNLTCIYSPVQKIGGDVVTEGASATGTHDPGAGFRLREGIFPTIENALVVGTWQVAEAGSDNWAIRVDDTVASEGFAKGNASITGAVFAAFAKSSKTIAGSDVSDWLVANNNVVFADIATNTAVNPTATADTDLVLLEGTPALFGVTSGATPEGDATYLGGALTTSATNWTASWAYGLYEGNRAQALWFE
ncbi:MAG: serine/threonine protein kinase [Proteobacteria bacterium]|nr:serine/threonine protein kinase [Pseudomonadota bacterium]